VIAYPDTSFLCALYVAQDNSAQAIAHYQRMTEPLQVTALLLYEFRQSARLQTYLNAQDPRKGYPTIVADKAFAYLQANLASGGVVLVPTDWADVVAKAERLSAQYTGKNGHRAFDLLHVATALHFGTREFLSFDTNQRKLAATEGLKVKP
jgi:predicted nucleic acid-binding protein